MSELKKVFKYKISVFMTNPNDPQLDNHALRDEWKNYRSIDITANWRAIYTEKAEEGEIVAFFVAIGTHQELYN